MSDNNPAQQRENLEQPISVDGGIEAMRRATKEIAEKDPNSEYTSAIAGLDVLKATPKDKEALTFMQSELINVMAKIAKKFPDSNLKEITPRNLSDITRRSGLQLRSSEVIALSKLDELQMHTENPVTQQLNQVWGAMVEKADDAKMGIGGKYLKRLKEKPAETIIYTAAGAAGIYIGLKLIGWLAGKAVDKAKDEVKEVTGKIFSTGNILAGVGLGALGLYLGKDAIKDALTKQLGITAGVDKLTSQLNDISEKISKAPNSEEAQKLKKQAEDLITDAQKAQKEIKGKIEESKFDEVAWQFVRKEGVPEEEKEKATRLSNCIKNLKTHFELSPQLLASIGNMQYEEALKNGGGMIAKAVHLIQLGMRGEINAKTAGDVVLTRSPEQFLSFLSDLLQNGGKLDEFKGKTVYEILELVEKNQEKYINQEKLKKFQGEKADKDEMMKMTNQLAGNPSLAHDQEFMNKLGSLGAKTGIEMVLDASSNAMGWVYENGKLVAKLEYKTVRGITDGLAERWIKSEDKKYKAMGYYLKYGAGFTLTCGAVTGSIMGVVKGAASGRGLMYGGWKVVSETIRYGTKGLFLPIDIVKGTALGLAKESYNWIAKDVTPKEAIQKMFKEYSILFREAKMNPEVARWLGTKSFIQEILAGETMISGAGAKGIKNLDSFLWELEILKEDMSAKKDGLVKLKRTEHAELFEREIERIKKIQEIMTEEPDRWHPYRKKFSAKRWEKAIEENLSGKLSDSKIRNILKVRGNERLGLLLLVDEKSPLAKACFKNPQLIEHLSKNEEILKVLMQNSELIKDPAVTDALSKGETEFFKAVEERAKIKPTKAEALASESVEPAGEAAAKSTAEAPKTGEAATKTPAKNLAEAAEADAQAFANPKTPEEVAAKQAAEETLQKAQALEQAEDAAKGAKPGSEAATKLAETEKAVTESAQTTAKAIEVAGKTSKLWQALKFVGKVGGVGAAGLGSVVSTYEAGKGFYEAATTNVEGRAGIEASHSALLTVNAAADTALLATMITTKGGAAVRLASRAWAPLIPVTWAGSKMYESVKEGNMTEFEWAQKYTHDDLVHQWFTTGRSVSEGDALLTGFKGLFSSESTDKKIDKDMENKREIDHKIYRVLVASQSNPELIKTLYTEKPSDEKDRKIESLIGGSYTKYHEYYFQQEGGESVSNYESARKFITNACAFNEIMQVREQEKTKGVTEMKVGSANLMDERFDIEGSDRNVKAKKAFMPSEIVKNYKGEILLTIKEKLPALHDNLENIDTSYLLLLYVQIMKNYSQAKEGTDKNALSEYLGLIRMSLKTRDINVDTAIQNQAYSNKNMPLDQLFQHLQDIGVKNSLSYRLFEKENIEKKPAVYAMHKLAQYFGYTGYQKESEIRAFFNESKANFHGIYYKDGNWYVQKEGWDFDTKIGRSINQDTIEKMISELYQNADNILEHRKTGTFVTVYDFTDQVKSMARLLESSYNEGVTKYEPKSPRISNISEGNIEKKAA